jgi:hypothetical protein
MKANARHVPGSTRSCRASLSKSTTPNRRFQNLGKSTYKTQTKCRQKCKCDFVKRSTSITYNFNAVTCLNFLALLPILEVDIQALGTESQDARLGSPVACYPFSLGEKVRMRDKLVTPGADRRPRIKFSTTVQNETKRDDLEFQHKRVYAVPTTYKKHLPRSSHFAGRDPDASGPPSALRFLASCGQIPTRIRNEYKTSTFRVQKVGGYHFFKSGQVP